MNCTNADISSPKKITLTTSGNAEQDTSQLELLIEGTFKEKGYRHFDGLFNRHIWELKPASLNNAIQFMVSQEPRLKTKPFLELRIDYVFEFISPATKRVLDNRERLSRLSVFLKKSSQVMPEFLFPFTDVEALDQYLAEIDLFLPFKQFDRKSFRKIFPNKKGTGNIVRKIGGPGT